MDYRYGSHTVFKIQFESFPDLKSGIGEVIFGLYPSDLKMPDSEPHILFQFKEKNAAEWPVLSKFFDDEMGQNMGSQGRV
jgi:hypothetical protein